MTTSRAVRRRSPSGITSYQTYIKTTTRAGRKEDRGHAAKDKVAHGNLRSHSKAKQSEAKHGLTLRKKRKPAPGNRVLRELEHSDKYLHGKKR